jgi:hypothetical protein
MLSGMQTTDQTPRTGPAQTGPRPGLFVVISLILIGAVWAAGAVWSFEEQTEYARSAGFQTPELLPWVLDGMAVAMATVALAASLDGRPAVLARLGTMLAIGASAASNAAWAWTRSHDEQTVTLAAGVPVVSMVAFEVLLAEVRRQVMRRRGQTPRVPLPELRLIRLVLDPSTLLVWRRIVLDLTAPTGPDRTAVEQTGDRTPVRAELVEQTAPDQTPAPDPLPEVEQTPVRTALADHPQQTDPDPEPPAPRPRRTPAALPARQTPRRTRPGATVRVVRSADDDTALARLRQWRAARSGQMPSLRDVQTIAGGGRSRAIRLRGLLGDDQTAQEPDRVAV